jgi:1-acyl-sn-glycerol-3-phosphate acyltransferase
VSRLLDSTPVRTVFSLWAWFALGLTVLVIVPLVAIVRLVTLPFDKGAYAAGRTFRMIGVMTEKLNPMWRFKVSGTTPSDPRRPYVVVANHESFVDILLICHVPMEMKWMSKSDFFKYPMIGWAMRLARDIRLDRDDAKGGGRALDQARERLDTKVSVMIFPEGTRSKHGELQPFKDGAFKLAIEKGAPILPLAVIGAREALIKHDWRFGFSRAEVRVLEPIAIDGLTMDDVPALRERTRDVIAAALADLRAERGEPSPVTAE